MVGARWSSAGCSRSRSCSYPTPIYPHYARPGPPARRYLGADRPAARRRGDVGARLDLLHGRDDDRACTAGSSRTRAPASPPSPDHLRRTDGSMIAYADNYLAGSLLTLLLPILLLIAIATWYVVSVRHVGRGPDHVGRAAHARGAGRRPSPDDRPASGRGAGATTSMSEAGAIRGPGRLPGAPADPPPTLPRPVLMEPGQSPTSAGAAGSPHSRGRGPGRRGPVGAVVGVGAPVSSRSRAVDGAAPWAGRPGPGPPGASGAGYQHPARPERAAVLPGLAARSQRRHGVLRLPLQAGMPAGRPSPGGRRALAAGAERPTLVVVSVNPLDTPASTPRRDPQVGPGRSRPLVLAAGHPRPAGPGLERVPHLRRSRWPGTSATPRRCT